MLLQAALNGPYTKAEHPAMPVRLAELVRDAVACVAAGARAIHLHPRDAAGREQLDAATIDGTVRAVRDACGVPVGVSTGAWIEPDLSRRLELLREWRAPDYASVNLSEGGALAVVRALLAVGVGIEAGVSTVADAELLGVSGIGGRVTRILIEPGENEVGADAAAALALVGAIHATLDRFALVAPRLQHGDGRVAWPLLADAVRRGSDTRIGLEDVTVGVDGARTAGNAALVRDARGCGAGGVD